MSVSCAIKSKNNVRINSEKEEEKNYRKAATLSTNIMLTSLTIERDVKLSIGIPLFSDFKT